eukprot:SAG11_NODE_8859_length_969_cov_0.893103_2_plen_144_part_00
MNTYYPVRCRRSSWRCDSLVRSHIDITAYVPSVLPYHVRHQLQCSGIISLLLCPKSIAAFLSCLDSDEFYWSRSGLCSNSRPLPRIGEESQMVSSMHCFSKTRRWVRRCETCDGLALLLQHAMPRLTSKHAIHVGVGLWLVKR